MLRRAGFRGSWYPYGPAENEEIVGSGRSHGNAIAAVLPHAGLMYSGSLIRSFFDQLPQNADRAILLSPSHYFRIPPGKIVTSSFTEAETPCGPIPARRLDADCCIEANEAIAAEHGLEMFLPFLGRRGMEVSFGIVSQLDEGDAKRFAAGLLPLLAPGTVLIASSDFTHYGRRFGYAPYGQDAKQRVLEHDAEAAGMLAEGRGEEAYRRFRSSTICGIAPAAIVAEASSQLGLEGEEGPHATSLDEGGGSDGDFVSYRTVIWRKADD